ncbi:MAG: M28 family metallopeptidase, partial [bacterium]
MTGNVRRIAAFVLFFISFISVDVINTVAQGGSPYLVRFPRADPAVVPILHSRGVPVNLKLERWLIVEAGLADLEPFEGAGIEYEVIDEEAWSEPYYLLTRPQRRELGPVPDLGHIILKTDEEALIKIADEQALELARPGFRLTRLFQRPLPLIEGRAEEPSPVRYRPGPDDVIGAIVNQVSQATVGSYVQRLQDFRTRYFATDSINAAAQWLFDRFREFGYTYVVFDTLVEQPYGVKLWNVIATKPGILYPDSVIIIGGHYDSIVLDGTDPYLWAPGADDNGSGTVAVLETARILANIDLDCTVKFACWTAEEIGLYGSWDYAEKAYNRGERIGLYLNFDMIGNLDESDPLRDVDILRNAPSQAYADLMAGMAEQYTTLIPFQYNAHSGSDHFPFMQYGYNIV